MTQHLIRDLDHLKRGLLDLSALVEESISKAIQALVNRKPELVDKVVAGDAEIDRREVEIEEECLKILALHQPVARDLRFIVAALKVNNDLERRGDLAVSIVDRVQYLSTKEPITPSLPFTEMAEKVHGMVRDSLRALVMLDTSLALKVLRTDDEVDALHRGMYGTIQKRMIEDSGMIKRGVHCISISRSLERIADLATNIAEDLIFMVEGKVVRHKNEAFFDEWE